MQNASWLAIETSTDVLSLALSRGAHIWSHTSAGGAQSSEHTLPQVMRLLQEAGLTLPALQAVVLGRGPGAFTGLRTACSVAQGLAWGAGLKVLPIDTLLALAESARAQCQAPAVPPANPAQTHVPAPGPSWRVLTVLDARMDQVYLAAYEHSDGLWRCVQTPAVVPPEAVQAPAPWLGQDFVAAGNAWTVYSGRWQAELTGRQITALPTAEALLRLAPQAWQAGQAVMPEEALPLYIRDKVALTTAERAQATIPT